MCSLIIGVFIFPFDFAQSELVEGEEHEHSITSKINLVDLAGSERCNSAMTSGDRLRVRAPNQQNALDRKHFVIQFTPDPARIDFYFSL